jgi:hypothetical protein
VKPIPILLGLAFFAGGNFFPFHNLVAQSLDVSATVQFSNGQTVSIADFSDQIGVQPGEAVSVTIQFTSDHAGEAINVEPLDGGRISKTSTAVSDQGLATFSFQAAGGAGLNRVVVRHGLQTLLAQFWVLSSNPQNNPPVVTPANPES